MVGSGGGGRQRRSVRTASSSGPLRGGRRNLADGSRAAGHDRVVEIREGTVADLPLLARMRIEFLAERTDTPLTQVLERLSGPMERFFEERFARDEVWTWFAEAPEPRADGLCAGVVTLLLGPVAPRPTDLRTVEAHVINMFVLPEHRSAGLGRRLITAGIDKAAAYGVRTVMLHATEDGRPMYESLGFAPHPDWMELPLPQG